VDTIETVTAFLARVEAGVAAKPGLRRGQVAWNRMGFMLYGATQEQVSFALNVAVGELDPFHDDARLPAFLAAAVKAGVLREG